MRNLFFVAIAALLFTTISCDSTAGGGNDAETKKNLEASKIISDAFGSGDVSKLDSVIDKDFVDHTDRGDIKGIDSMKAMIKMVHANFKDMKMELLKELADKEYVFSWMRFTGNSDGHMGMPKGPYDMTAIEVSRFKNGKCVEHWEFMEPREMMKMMAQMPVDEHKTDSTGN